MFETTRRWLLMVAGLICAVTALWHYEYAVQNVPGGTA